MKSLLFLMLAAAIPLNGAALRDTSFPTSDSQSLRFDVTVQPIFPPLMIANGVTRGQTRILINVSHEGVLTDSLVIAYTHKSFADSALEAIERWKFEPMLVRGQAVPSQVELRFNFEATGVVITLDVSTAAARLVSMPEGFVYAPCTLRELDRIPTPVLADSPAYPKTLRASGVFGNVVVEFYIDEYGTVRMPAVMSADHEELGFLALEAVRDWRFEAPTRHGRPVLAKVRQVFRFRADQESSAS